MWPIAHYQKKANAVEKQLNNQLSETRLEAQNRLKTINKLKHQLEKKEAEIRLKEVKIKKLTQIKTYPRTGYGNAMKSGHGCSGYVPGQCVWGVCQWLSWIPDGWGSAYEWDDNARRQGFTVSNVPKVGAVAQTDANHVGVVTAVGKGQFKMKDMNCRGPYTICHGWHSTSGYRFIYP